VSSVEKNNKDIKMKAMYRLAFEAHKKGPGFYPLGSLAGIDLQRTGKSPGFWRRRLGCCRPLSNRHKDTIL